MKSFKVILMVIFTSVLMMNCTSRKTLAETENGIQREWMMVSFKDYPKEKLTKYQAKINLIPNAETPDQYSAKMGCNNMFFSAKMMSGNKIEFSQVGSTRMYCQDMMDLESDFGKMLPLMTEYKINGHFLTLSDGKGNEMKFVAADWD